MLGPPSAAGSLVLRRMDEFPVRNVIAFSVGSNSNRQSERLEGNPNACFRHFYPLARPLKPLVTYIPAATISL